MLWLNACVRCETGALSLDENNERHCLQCGHIQYSLTDPRAASELVRLLKTDDGTGSDTALDLRQPLQTAGNSTRPSRYLLRSAGTPNFSRGAIPARLV